MAKEKKRLDELVHDLFPDLSKRHIQSLIMQGKVKIDDRIETKPGTKVVPGTLIYADIETPKYVGRAGFKLEKALNYFAIDVNGLVALDAGISTGGFTDCLLQHGVRKVYGIDVGYGQLHEKIRSDSRVSVHERTNLRTLEGVGELVDVITLDLSFISVLKVMDAVERLLKPDGKLIVLIKPQFEAGKDQVSKGGIVKDPAVHQQVIEEITHGIAERGFRCIGVTESPIQGADGNKEFLAYFIRG